MDKTALIQTIPSIASGLFSPKLWSGIAGAGRGIGKGLLGTFGLIKKYPKTSLGVGGVSAYTLGSKIDLPGSTANYTGLLRRGSIGSPTMSGADLEYKLASLVESAGTLGLTGLFGYGQIKGVGEVFKKNPTRVPGFLGTTVLRPKQPIEQLA